MDHAVPLDRLPADLRFPAAFEGRFGYDEERRRLVFRGFMSKDDYDLLARLSADWPYRRALEELFRRSVLEDPAPRRGLRRVLSALTGHA